MSCFSPSQKKEKDRKSPTPSPVSPSCCPKKRGTKVRKGVGSASDAGSDTPVQSCAAGVSSVIPGFNPDLEKKPETGVLRRGLVPFWGIRWA